MTQAKSVSLSKFTETVQAAVKVAVQKHPKFNIEVPQGVEFAYLIRGIPVPENLLGNISMGETQAFANEVAANIATQTGVAAEARLGGGHGVVFSSGGHVIVGIPAVDSLLLQR
jgi:hypothetical protein